MQELDAIKMPKLEVIKQEIVTKGFPELSNVDISVSYKRLKDAYFEVDRIRKGAYHIDTNMSLRKAPIIVIEGGMAHEIAHIAMDFRWDDLTHKIEMDKYRTCKLYEAKDERKTDQLVIARGYGLQLLEFSRYADARRKKVTENNGLTTGELEKIIKKGFKEKFT